MSLFVGTVLSGISIGVTLGLLAFAVVVLYRSTGVANFAQGNIATLATFLVFTMITRVHVPAIVLIPLGIAAGGGVGAVTFLVSQRPRDDANHLNLVVRTLAVYLLLGSILTAIWARGEPYAFPSVIPNVMVVRVSGLAVSSLTLGSVAIASVLAVGFWYFFNRTRTGLLLEAVAESRSIARLLGVRARRYDLLAWSIAGSVAAIVGILTAPTTLLATNLMDLFLLYSFTAAIMAGLTNLVGVYAAAVVVGIVTNLAGVYWGPEASTLVVFLLVLGVLLFRPHGIFGHGAVRRL